MTGSVAIVIVNWNSGRQLLDCVETIHRWAGGVPVSVVVVDNGSSDQSAALIRDRADVHLISAGENLGFARACNRGAAAAEPSDFLLFLNPDAGLMEGSLPRAVRFMSEQAAAGVGVCGVALIDEHGQVARSCARFPTPTRLAVIASGLDRVFPRFGTTMGEWDHGQSRQVDQVIGAFFLVRRDLFENLGGFDERFFVYFEEVDFSFRASLAGFSSFFLSDVHAFHAGGGTSGQVKAKRLFYSLRSRILYASKHFAAPGVALVVLTTFLLEPVARVLNQLARGRFHGVAETVLAFGMLLRWAARRQRN
jgi:GT2 family glycosyltransferase